MQGKDSQAFQSRECPLPQTLKLIVTQYQCIHFGETFEGIRLDKSESVLAHVPETPRSEKFESSFSTNSLTRLTNLFTFSGGSSSISLLSR